MNAPLVCYSDTKDVKISKNLFNHKIIQFYPINHFGHKRCRHRQRSPPPKCIYFSEIFTLSQIKITKNNPSKDFKSVKRP